MTLAMKKNRAREIAQVLNDARRWNSHGIGINIDRLRNDLNLKIDDFGKMDNFNELIRSYHKLLTDYMQKRAQGAVVHTRMAYQQLL